MDFQPEKNGRAATSSRSRTFDGYKLGMLHDAKKIILIAAAALLVLSLIFGVSQVDGVSMLDTLHSGELVFYTRVNPFGYHKDDIISIRLPSGEFYIKRIVATAGDTIDLRDGVLYVNGTAETGSFIRNETLPEQGSVTYPFTVSEGNVFALGDNRRESVDSRAFGQVNTRQIKGIVRFSVGSFFVHFH